MHSNTALVTTQHNSPFDAIRQLDETGREFWSARDLQAPLGYVEWRKFEDAIERAMLACQNSGYTAADHFGGAAKMVSIGSGGLREVNDYKLTRYASYLTAMNGDPRKPEIAAAQTYFAIKTREAEMTETELETDPDKLELKIQCNRLERKNLLLQRTNFHLKKQLASPALPRPDAETAILPDVLLAFLSSRSPQRFTASEIRQYGPRPCRNYKSSSLVRALTPLLDAGTVQEEWQEGKIAPRFFIPEQQKGSLL